MIDGARGVARHGAHCDRKREVRQKLLDAVRISGNMGGMTGRDALFLGTIPAYYDRCLGPFLFEPYAADLARRVAATPDSRVLEAC